MDKQELVFKIDAFTPETLPMGRLAAYMTELAELFANDERVHFDKVMRGSAVLKAWVEPQAAPKVHARLLVADAPDAPDDVKRAYRNLNKLLRDDNATGLLKEGKEATIMRFPGVNAPTIQTFRVHEAGILEGMVIRIGGIDESVPIWLRDSTGVVHKNCHTRNVATAREIAKHYLAGPIRLVGSGKWLRSTDEIWELEDFTIESFERIDEAPLSAAIDAVKAVKNNAWNDYPDPMAELKRVREGS
ncbi:MAG: MFS transporter [Betaproteobacteria bacterium]|nr:MFS transporter [Betaproteobacteria bacterium]